MSIARLGRSLLAYSVGAMLALQSLGVLLPSHAHAAGATLRINEINWAGSSTDASDQWVEFVNKGSVQVDLAVTPYSLSIPSLSETISLNSGQIDPGDYLVIYRKSIALSSIHFVASHASYLQTATLTLPTTAAEYDLYDETAAVVDMVSDTGAGLPFKGTASTSTTHAASMSRVDALVSGSTPANWYTAGTVGTGFNALAPEQYGTPGMANVELTKPVASIAPNGSTTLPTNPTVSGSAAMPATNVDVHFARVSHDPANYVKDYSGTVSGAAFSVTATMPSLLPGRYAVSAFSSDADANRSQWTKVPSTTGDPDSNYVVLPATSTVATPVIISPTPGAITNQPTVNVAGTLDGATTYDSLEVLRNGVYYGTFPVSGSTFSFSMIPKLNQTNLIQVVGVDALGVFSVPAAVSVVSDAIAPNPVDTTKVTVNANQPGTHDSFVGNTMAAEAGTTLYVYSDTAQTKLLATLTVAPDGSFPLVDIGDNLYSKVYLVLQDAAGNRSSVAVVNNPTGFTGNAGVLSPMVSAITQDQADVSWTKVPAAVKYRVKYKMVGGTYGSVTNVCTAGNATCAFSTTIHGLFADADYVVAIAAVDAYGNESTYEEASFHTVMAPVPAAVVVVATPVVAPVVKTSTAKKTDVVTKVEATPTPTPTPSPTPEKGEVKSVDITAKNWTPWIVLAVLAAIAVLATVGYFYWFGGEAGEVALASVLAERAKREEEEAAAKSTSKGKKTSGKDRRW
jgi:hypothetical protein